MRHFSTGTSLRRQDILKKLIASKNFKDSALHMQSLALFAQAKMIPVMSDHEIQLLVMFEDKYTLAALAHTLRENKEKLENLFDQVSSIKESPLALADFKLFLGAPQEVMDYYQRHFSENELINAIRQMLVLTDLFDVAKVIATLSHKQREALYLELKQGSSSGFKFIDDAFNITAAIIELEGFKSEVERCEKHLKTHGTFITIEPNQEFNKMIEEALPKDAPALLKKPVPTAQVKHSPEAEENIKAAVNSQSKKENRYSGQETSR
jgi:hypothetical protein